MMAPSLSCICCLMANPPQAAEDAREMPKSGTYRMNAQIAEKVIAPGAGERQRSADRL